MGRGGFHRRPILTNFISFGPRVQAKRTAHVKPLPARPILTRLISPACDHVGHKERRVELARERFLFGGDSGVEESTWYPWIGTLKVEHLGRREVHPGKSPKDRAWERKRHPGKRDDFLLLCVKGLGL